MDKYKKHYSLIVLIILAIGIIVAGVNILLPMQKKIESQEVKISNKQKEKSKLENDLKIVKARIKKIKDSIITAQKKIYSPQETDLGDETLYFTMYNDVIEMVHNNNIKIRTITQNPEVDGDPFKEFSNGSVYFVSDVEMELVSNYVNLGKLIQDLYQYNYYIKINNVDVYPYSKDKKILITKMSLRLYSRTEPMFEEETAKEITKKEPVSKKESAPKKEQNTKKK